MSLLHEALTYLEMGWAVYPAHNVDLSTGYCSCGRLDCPCPGKHPVGRWLEYQNRLPTKDEVKLWFSTLDCNIGTLTGAVSGIVVVDVDGEDGVHSLKGLGLEPTLKARSGGGGYHLFYKATESATTRTKVVPGVDVRGDGGYIILSPSLHRSGNLYEWLEPIRPLAPFDAELFNKIGGSRVSEEGWQNEIIGGVSEGSRSLSAARLAGRYLGLGLSLGETWVLVQAWNERNDPPLPELDLKRTVKAIHRKHMTSTDTKPVTNLDDILRILKGDRNG